MSEPFIGQIILTGFNFAIRGYAICTGQLLPISQNSALFSLLGTIYGGDGRTTFALPDLQGRTALGMGHGPGLSDQRIGAKSGFETTNIAVSNMPNHTHTATLHGETAPGSQSDPGGNMLGIGAIYAPPSAGPDRPMAAGSIVVGAEGGSQPINNMQPYLVLNYQIALQGIFPSRN